MQGESAPEGDPGKLAYLHNADWQAKPFLGPGLTIDPRVCPGCLFPNAMRKHEHVQDSRCKLWGGGHHAAAD